MRLIDFYPSKGCFSLDERVTFEIELEGTVPVDVLLRVSIKHLAGQTITLQKTVLLEPGLQTIQMQWTPPEKPAGYSCRLEIPSENISATTAFDVLLNWTDFPRYGFLVDFNASRPDPEATLEDLTRFHINGLQFYDWQYRHDQLLSPIETYIDPLGREMSLASVRALVQAAHQYGMAAMPYLAIYAASAEFWRAHPGWALYDRLKSPIAFGENFLGLMDPSQESQWTQHLLNEGRRALEAIPFDGLHIDQYGDPKQAWNVQGNPVDLPKAFVDFIQAASDEHPKQAILFNAVGNWPIEALAECAVAFLYIEVWPPDVEYRHLAEIVLNAVRLSHGKAVVIALYLPAGRPANNLLADAVILACGGTRIELGEDARLLSDPYFPKHEEIAPALLSELRKLSDYMVRNGEWLRPYTLSEADREKWSQAELNPAFIFTDPSMWAVARSYPAATIIQLINFTNLPPHQRWDEGHDAPAPCEDVEVRIQVPERPAQVLWDCPERSDGPQELDFTYAEGLLTLKIPKIYFTGLIAVHE
ncbi:MAG: glycoside hydrolase family 66 protein [Bacteroidota bacterium]